MGPVLRGNRILRGTGATIAFGLVLIFDARAESADGVIATVANRWRPETAAPSGMVWVPGGEFSMGAKLDGAGNCCELPMASNDAGPIHRVRVDGFWMDATTVTNAQFEEFVRATNYITVAERAPTREEFPTASKENLFAGSVVFVPTDHEVPLTNHLQWWDYVKRGELATPARLKERSQGQGKLPGCSRGLR